MKEDDNNWPEPDRVGRQELEIVMGNEHISFTTSKIGSLMDVQTSKDPEGLRIFYYLVQVCNQSIPYWCQTKVSVCDQIKCILFLDSCFSIRMLAVTPYRNLNGVHFVQMSHREWSLHIKDYQFEPMFFLLTFITANSLDSCYPYVLNLYTL